MIFGFYTPQLLCPDFSLLLKKPQSVGMIAPSQNSLAALLLYSCLYYHALTPFTRCSADSFQTRLSPTQRTKEHTTYASACSVLLRPEVCRAPSSEGAEFLLLLSTYHRTPGKKKCFLPLVVFSTNCSRVSSKSTIFQSLALSFYSCSILSVTKTNSDIL